ncbi:hypothetical protein AAC387_Pa02g4414 [Persea americana]
MAEEKNNAVGGARSERTDMGLGGVTISLKNPGEEVLEIENEKADEATRVVLFAIFSLLCDSFGGKALVVVEKK